MMKRLLLILAALMLGTMALMAQEELMNPVQTGPAPMDSTLLGRSAFSVIGSGVEISQSAAVRQSLENHIQRNASKGLSGYRIRVYYDNGPQARGRAASIASSLREQLDVAVYLSYESPNYKVTVGDFRSKEESLHIYNALKSSYPTAYIIKETINYPR